MRSTWIFATKGINMEISFSGQFTKEDFVQAFKAHTTATILGKVFYYGIWVVVAYMVITFVSALAQGGNVTAILLSYGLPVLLMGFLIWLTYSQPYQSAKRAIKNPEFQAPVSGQVNEEQIDITTQESTVEIPWSKFQKVLDRGDFVLMYRGKNGLSLFPRRFFQSDADWQAFKNLAKEKIGRR